LNKLHLILAAALATAAASTIQAQTPPQVPTQPPPPDAPAPQQDPGHPAGKILFSRGSDTATDATPASDATTKPTPKEDALNVTDAERDALTFTAYDLDLHLTQSTAALAARTGLTVRNDSPAPLTRIILQVSSSLHWDAISLRTGATSSKLPFLEHPIDTDADHTGLVSEAVVTLTQPLAPGASLDLIALYSGTIHPSAERLERIGAPHNQAILSDWDAIAPASTALRGFGNVLWYPFAAPPVFLGDGAKLFDAVGHTKLREASATIRLHVAVEYIGDPPDSAFFCGSRQPLTALSDNANVPIAETRGIATAEWPAHPIGYRMPSLFITDHPATAVEADPSLSSDSAQRIEGLLSATTDHYDALPSYAAATALVQPMLSEWLGPRPLAPLNLVDRDGQPFEDEALLVRPLRIADPTTLTQSLAHSLTHAWMNSTSALPPSRLWIDEGLAQFMTLLWIERAQSRATALATLTDAAQTLAIAEPADPDKSPGQPLISPLSETFYRSKAAAVWWMLRDIVGDSTLQQALQAYRAETASDPKLDQDPATFEHTLERISHKDLRWFFDDWVYRDRGLPDLSIAIVGPSELPAAAGHAAGWLVAVDVRNDGDAAAEVPVTVRSTATTITERLRIAAHSSASTRIVFPGNPDEVLVNDGSVPEQRTETHTRKLTRPKP
jgi:Peptidase family M1 domain